MRADGAGAAVGEMDPLRHLSAALMASAIPPPAHEALDTELRLLAHRMAGHFLDFCDVAARAIRDGVHERYGYLSEATYFEERIGVSYRTVRRWLSVRAGLERLPEADRAEARPRLARLGVVKAAALAPVLGHDGHDWRRLVGFAEAKGTTAEAVQARVADVLGTVPRGVAVSAPGERFLRLVVNAMPPDLVHGSAALSLGEYVEAVFRDLMQYAEQTNPVAAFLTMVDLANQHLLENGHGVDVGATETR